MLFECIQNFCHIVISILIFLNHSMTRLINQLALELGHCLKKRGLTLVTAESCTGGGLAYFITEIPGSSEWFEQGFVTYSNYSKETLLNVKKETLKQHGAVSQQVAREMAEGALANSQAGVAIAITGIAGPGGGTVEKPAGTVWFGVSGAGSNTITEIQHFTGDRHAVREQAILFGIQKLIGEMSS
jgi:nicotinamide-nucleotide amidase